MLSIERMEQAVRAGLEYAQERCSFAFQGGEPTLAGLDFYRQVIALEKRYARPGVKIFNAIQTNGYIIDDEWAAFLAENQFLVGLSLDGPADIHNKHRMDCAGKGSWSRVMQTVRLFNRHQVAYNILCVVTGQNARGIQRVYRFFKKQGLRWLQFIPCLEPLGQARGVQPYHLSAEGYGEFLIRLFDLWFADLRCGNYISIRHLDNWISMILGEPPEACGTSGRCSIQFVIEGDGGVYPCDFYVLDQWRMGAVGQETLAQIWKSEIAQRFMEESCRIPKACRQCEFHWICRNGCRRDRLLLPDGSPDQNYYCAAFRRFFSEREQELYHAARIILRARGRA